VPFDTVEEAPPGSSADLLIVITPGVERFEYFRLTAQLQLGKASLEDLLATQDRFDNHFLDSPEWRAARADEVAQVIADGANSSDDF
jgi:hypothetical protein